MVETASTTTEETTLYCTVHPTVATSLRCNKCGRPMCTRCAVRTPVGYRCKECVRGQQNVFFNAQALDPFIQAAVAFILSGIVTGVGGIFLMRIGFFGLWLSFIGGTLAGGLLADAAHRVVGRRRSRYGWLFVSAAIGLGALAGGFLSGFMFDTIDWLIFTGFAISASIGRLRLGR